MDSLVHDPDMLKLIIAKFGEDRVLLGSDYPFPLGEIDRPGGLIEKTVIAENYENHTEVLEKLLWKNAAGFLGLR